MRVKNLNKKCFMCGIISSNGIILNERHICICCEQQIVNSNAMKSSYTNYVNLVNRILFN